VSPDENPARFMSDTDARAVRALTDIRQTHLTDLTR